MLRECKFCLRSQNDVKSSTLGTGVILCNACHHLDHATKCNLLAQRHTISTLNLIWGELVKANPNSTTPEPENLKTLANSLRAIATLANSLKAIATQLDPPF